MRTGGRGVAGVAWTLCIVVVAAAAGATLIAARGGAVCAGGVLPPSTVAAERCRMLLETGDLLSPTTIITVSLIGLVFGVLGALVASRQGRNAVGWLLLAIGLVLTVGNAATAHVLRAVADPVWAESAAGWVADTLLGNPAFFGLFALFLLLAPEGRPASRGWRRVVLVAACTMAVLVVIAAIRPGPMVTARWLDNPLGVSAGGQVRAAIEPVLLLVLVVTLLLAVASPFIRFRRADGDVRQQLSWLVAASTLVGVTLAAGPALWALDTSWAATAWTGAFLIALAALPAAAAIAIFRHRLYAIDIVVNRALVYASLASLVLGVYVLAVVVVGGVVQAGAPTRDPSLPLLATAVAAMAFHPARVRVQAAVNRLLYGHRKDPYTVLVQLGERLHDAAAPATALVAAVETIAETLRLPFVAVDYLTVQGWRRAAAQGEEPAHVDHLPLTHQGEEVGRLLLGGRPGEDLRQLERASLGSLTKQVASAVHGGRLADELQASRERIVLLREDERRRIRRDLHDGVGPSLAGIAMGLQAARNQPALLSPEHDQALECLLSQTETAMAEVLRVVDGLRPAALDQLGLVAALRHQADALFSTNGHATTRLDLDVPELPASLPAALEVAAYLIAVEALTNVARHARARTCELRLHVADGLHIEVSDDGRGLPVPVVPGVGLRSMRERAAELGGTCRIDARPGGGTRVVAGIPIPLVAT